MEEGAVLGIEALRSRFDQLSSLKEVVLVPLLNEIFKSFMRNVSYHSIKTSTEDAKKFFSDGKLCGHLSNENDLYGLVSYETFTYHTKEGESNVFLRTRMMTDESGDDVFFMNDQVQLLGEKGVVDHLKEMFDQIVSSKDLDEWWRITADSVKKMDDSFPVLDEDNRRFYSYKRGFLFKWRKHPFEKKWWHPIAYSVDFLLCVLVVIARSWIGKTISIVWWIPILIITRNPWFWLGAVVAVALVIIYLIQMPDST